MAREITLNHICKIEGHANLNLKIEKNKVKKCELQAFEGARFFEALVIEKNIEDIQEIVSRICGICSSAHSVCSIQGLEDALGIKPTAQQKFIREMLMFGERIRSHATHLYFLALPDYFNVPSILEIGKEHKSKIDDALKIITLGNQLVEKFGGREMHPFLKIKEEMEEVDYEKILQQLKNTKPIIMRTIKLFSEINYPEISRETDYLSLHQEEDYVVLKENKPYMLGAMARINNNHNQLEPETKKILNEIMKKKDLEFPLKNPFYNNICQAIEILEVVNRTIKNIENAPKKEETQKIKYHSGHGVSAVEAPRGTLFHEYKIDKNGKIIYCNIITPTCQNLNMMEQDITALVNELLKKNTSKEEIVKHMEKLIRAYDPCFSCSTHFLKVNWE
ncbi:MAG: nickel-dependent hydrogenase large subunit [archaeon GW2011_AR13]|nr:MAG: nickel-dependent hydrogenase large subunit [archaeon GW2011_AR13]